MSKKFGIVASTVVMIGIFLIRAGAQDISPPATTQPEVGVSIDFTKVDRNLDKQISDLLDDCGTIKPGMTRAELLKIFATEGGLSTAKHRTYIHRRCPTVKVDVDFTLSNPKDIIQEQLTDTISKISKPYLDWTVAD